MSIVSVAIRVVTALVFSATSVLATENQPVAWVDLIDQSVQTFEDPYRDLSSQQIEVLRTIVQNRARLNDPTLSEAQMADSSAKINVALTELAEDSIDADWLIDQRWIVAERREKAATAANPNLDGQTVTLAGFAIPAPVDADGTTVVYLVPQRGMCSHMPPPNPNQMIRARLRGDWSPSMMHEPVKLSGTLFAEETKHAFNVVDGIVPMRSSFVMDVSVVETLDDLQNGFKATSGRASQRAVQSRAARQPASQENFD